MAHLKASTAEQLHAAQIAVTNSLADPEIKTAVAEYGYTATKLNAGKELLEVAQAAINAQKMGKGSQKMSTANLKAAEKAARDAYQALAQVARASLSTPDLARLGLTSREPRATDAFIAAAYTLFDNAGSIAGLPDLGYTDEKITAGRLKIEAYDRANQAQEAAKGAAQQATQEQEAALAAMQYLLT